VHNWKRTRIRPAYKGICICTQEAAKNLKCLKTLRK